MSTAFDSKSVEHVDKGGLTKESFMTTNPVDRKNFPATNWAHQCWQQYNIYMLCVKKNSGDEDACSKEKFTAYEQCPLPWVRNATPLLCYMQILKIAC